MTLSTPFYLVDEDSGQLVSELLVNIKTGDSVHLKCMFSTLFKKDTHNETVNGVLTICYAEHQHNDQINLTGEIFFPNVYLETNNIDFGCILNNTEVFQDIKMTNIGPLPVHYKWKFILEKGNVVSTQVMLPNAQSELSSRSISDDIADQGINEHRITSVSNLDHGENHAASNITEREQDMTADSEKIENHADGDDKEDTLEDVLDMVQVKEAPNVLNAVQSNKLEALLNKRSNLELPSIEEIFDISPLYGCLHPGEAQNLKVTYYGHKEIKAFVRAICEVTNGPNYELNIKGEASVLCYELSEHSINFDYIVSVI